MNPRPIVDADVELWRAQPRVAQSQAQIMLAPPDMDDCEPCGAVATLDVDGNLIMRVPMKLDEIELAQLARGGTLWLSTWGGLPPFSLVVVPRDEPQPTRRVRDDPRA